MRRCYRNVALAALGFVLFASSTFSNSCSFTTLEVYAAEDTLSEEAVTDTIKITRMVKLSENVTVTETVKGADNLDTAKFSAQNDIQTGEENVETEVPAEETELEPEVVEEEEKDILNLEYNDYNVLLKIVEAEAGGENLTGKIMVANVILNRVNSDRFPNTVTEVVYQKSQFSPTIDGRIDTVSISQETLTAVERALSGEDHSNGALYFRSVHCNSTWFDNRLTRVAEHGNHIFYTI